MSTTIILASQRAGGTPIRLRVREAPDEVRQAWPNAGGGPFSLTADRDGNQVWVNPAAVVSWSESTDRARGDKGRTLPDRRSTTMAEGKSVARARKGTQPLYVASSSREYTIEFATPETTSDSLPVPPTPLMEYYESAESHLLDGHREIGFMLTALESCGFVWNSCETVLEFGCSNGRLIRWLAGYAKGRQIWGVDIQADKIRWAMENLSPALHFATTTHVPHLPFPDRHFDLVFAGSVFTHIGDLHVAWLLELARVLSQRGFLFITVHDELSVEIIREDTRPGLVRFHDRIRQSPLSDAVLSGDFDFVSLKPYDGGMLSQVFMNSDYLQRMSSPFLRLVRRFPNAFGGGVPGFQTGYVFVSKDAAVARRSVRRS